MKGLVGILCPSRAVAFTYPGSLAVGLGEELLQLGTVARGAVGTRLISQDFFTFMENLLCFQPSARATAAQLLYHPWLDNFEIFDD